MTTNLRFADVETSVTAWMRKPLVVDVLLALAIGALGLIGIISDFGDDPGSSTGIEQYGLVVLGAAAMLFRRQKPVLVLVVVAACRIMLRSSVGNDAALAPAAMVALYAVARIGDRRKNVLLAGAAGVIIAAIVAGLDDEAFVPEFLGDAGLMLLPVAIADAARSRADRVQTMIDTEAEQRVSAERLRIARDLHDVVAHSLSTIAVQSGVAAHLIDQDTEQAKRALETINDTGKTALEDLRGMVGVLRSTDDAPLRPAPIDPDDVSQLVMSAGLAGVEVAVNRTGEFPVDVSDSCVIAVHRIVQEALTNVARHAGSAPTTLSIEHGSHAVNVSVSNAPGTSPNTTIASTGVGIIGMIERAEALGGSVKAGPIESGGFEVTATVPYGRRSIVGADE